MSESIWNIDYTQMSGQDFLQGAGVDTGLLGLTDEVKSDPTKTTQVATDQVDALGNPITGDEFDFKTDEIIEEEDDPISAIVKKEDATPGLKADGTFTPYKVVDDLEEDEIDLGEQTGDKSAGQDIAGSAAGTENQDLLAKAFGSEKGDKFGMKQMGQELMKGPSYTYQTMFGRR